MEIINLIQGKVHGRKYQFLVIGGFAATEYLPGRNTRDIDLLTCKEERIFWDDMIQSLGYELTVKSNVYSQFRFKEIGQFPLDIMYVGEDTYMGMLNDSKEAKIGISTVRIPSPRHLLTMKIHALKTREGDKRKSDLSDVSGLIRFMGIDLQSPEFRAIIDKYGNEKVLNDIYRYQAD